MRIHGTMLDIPVPVGWTITPDLKAKTVTLVGKVPDSTHYKDIVRTVTLPLNDVLNLDWRAAARVTETRLYQPHSYVNGKGWIASGVWKPSRGNRKRRADYLIFELATGRL